MAELKHAIFIHAIGFLDGKVTHCNNASDNGESGPKAELCFEGKSFLGRHINYRSIKGKIVSLSKIEKTYEINGHWDRNVTVKDTSNGKVTVIYSAKDVISALKTPIFKDVKVYIKMYATSVSVEHFSFPFLFATHIGECLRNVTIFTPSPVVWHQVSYIANLNGVAYTYSNLGAECVGGSKLTVVKFLKEICLRAGHKLKYALRRVPDHVCEATQSTGTRQIYVVKPMDRSIIMYIFASKADLKKTEHLLAVDGAKERLSLYESSLAEDSSFDSTVKGCVFVFHIASPVQFIVNDPQTQLIDPALKGILNVLKSASKVPSLKRVIFISSIAAVLVGSKGPVFGDMVDETWFSDVQDLMAFLGKLSVGGPKQQSWLVQKVQCLVIWWMKHGSQVFKI
ncbi:bifunctional polymyxin resistance protein, ArnA [Artemisia annua]|uniref:Bifunctional polymyxin resistance protein, ArnA n=1 Tax=Artemisia annua TaxID=35608 RepID=A0A2U1KQX8_ARTAN|nr:bifunctional polymyxin resistance protein, ArnA [Artemisia annua]